MTIKVLFVEDVATDADLAAVELKRAGIEFVARRVDTESEFVRELNEFRPDVVLSDVSMPKFAGYDALTLVRHGSPNTPFVFLSGTIGEDTAIESFERGATDYVQKDNLKRLGPAVRRAIEVGQARIARQATEDTLREHERRYRELFQSNPHPMWVYDTETLRFLAVNDVALSRYGFSRDEFLAMTIQGIRLDADVPELLEVVTKPMPTVSDPRTWRHHTKRGELIDVEISSHDLVFEGRPARMVVAFDITERKRALEELQESNRRFNDLLANVELVSLMLNREGRITYCNDYLLRVTGWQRQDIVGRDWFQLFIPREMIAEMKELYSAQLANAPAALHHENEILSRSGARRLIRWNNSVLRSGSGDVIGTASIGEDITERKQHEDKIARLSRIHAVLSGINSAIVRIRDPKELYQEACRIAVEHGGLRMAWIGLVNKSTLRIEPAAWAGYESGFLSSVARLSLEENTLEGRGVAGRAIRSKAPVVTNDFASDPQIVFKEETLARGYRAGVVLPLVMGEDAVGLFSLYASETDFFDDEEVELLTELAADISFSMEHIQQEERLHYLAYYDALTGLANRSLLQDRLLQAMHSAERFGLNVTVLVVNLDRFKVVNDTLGHAAGDDLLKVAGGRLVACVRDIDTVARFGSDEFVVVLAGTEQDGDSATQIAQRILKAFAEPVVLAGQELFVTCSVGAAIYPRDATREDALLKNASAAMYRAKEHGRNNVQFYTPEANARAEERLSLESALRRALERDEFRLHYQPQVDLRTGQVIGLEALIRWDRGDLGMVPPARFIRIAEDTGLILPIGEWVLRTAAQQNKAWQSEGLAQIRIAVNLSARQFRQKDLPRRIQRILADTGLESRYLEVELTESMLMLEIESAIEMMSELRRVGVQISLDDFGTGYSSLSHLKRFPIHVLKIDQSFVREVTSDPDSAAIARAIIAMAHSLRLTVLAEGVETDGQLAFLRAHNCDQMQGYLFSKPLPTDELAQLLRERRSLPPRSGLDESATILLLDDEPSILAALRRALRGAGYRILTAATPSAAFEMLAQDRAQVIVSDQRMPAMTGTEFFGRVKDLYPETVRIMLSGYSEIKSVTEAINQGAVYKFLSKPWDDDELRAVVKDAFQRFASQKP